MPFPKVFGLPDATPLDLQRKIRADIIAKLAAAVGIEPSTIRPFFPQDRIGDPDEGQDNTIYCELDSGMFVGKPARERKAATSAIAEVIWQAFFGMIEVEVFIGDLDSTGKTLRKPALTTFVLDGIMLEVEYVETIDVIAAGVKCDSYTFVVDSSNDLAIITIEPGYETPLQVVLSGTRTIEGYVSGKGKLIVHGLDGEIRTYPVGYNYHGLTVEVKVGEKMQWKADKDYELVFSEVCSPPYVEGRYENVE